MMDELIAFRDPYGERPLMAALAREAREASRLQRSRDKLEELCAYVEGASYLLTEADKAALQVKVSDLPCVLALSQLRAVA